MTKEKFVAALNELEAAESLQRKVATAVRQFNNVVHNDYPEQYGLVISHNFLVIDLLAEIMGDSFGDIEYFCQELEFGKKYSPGVVTEADGTEIDISTAEKLYDYLNKERIRGGVHESD